jgi:ankyrin repeat protein
MRAAAGGDNDVVRLLMERGADCSARLADGFSVLHFAAGTCSAEIIILLLDKGLDVHDGVRDARLDIITTPLHQAAARGNDDAARALIEEART